MGEELLKVTDRAAASIAAQLARVHSRRCSPAADPFRVCAGYCEGAPPRSRRQAKGGELELPEDDASGPRGGAAQVPDTVSFCRFVKLQDAPLDFPSQAARA
jgi:hypothetical protein